MKSSKYLIVGNGPFLAKSIIKEAAEDACIVALDGAANKLRRLGIQPDIILGDFDSIYEDKSAEIWGISKPLYVTNKLFSKPYLGSNKILIVPAGNQNYTDLQKALKFVMYYADKYDFVLAQSVHITCATGGRIDHDQANLRTLHSEHSQSCPIYLHNEHQTITFASNQRITISGNHLDLCGIFGMPVGSMSVVDGELEYGSKTPYELSPLKYSSSNRLIGDKGVVIDITGDALIVNPPLLKSQRIFMQKTRVEQLTILLNES